MNTRHRFRVRGLEGAAAAHYFEAYFQAFAPALGALHTLSHNRAALACDLMEPYRPQIDHLQNDNAQRLGLDGTRRLRIERKNQTEKRIPLHHITCCTTWGNCWACTPTPTCTTR